MHITQQYFGAIKTEPRHKTGAPFPTDQAGLLFLGSFFSRLGLITVADLQRALVLFADVLIDLGIDPQRISVRGFGEAYPLAENASSRGRAQNRRVEIFIAEQN